MANKNITIKAALDMSGFDEQVNKLQSKLKAMQKSQDSLGKASSNLSNDPILGGYAQKAFGQFNKDSKKELETSLNSQRREAMQQNIQMKGKQQELQKLEKIEGDMTKSQKQRVELLTKEIDLLKQRNRTTIEGASDTQRMLGRIEESKTSAGGAGKPPPETKEETPQTGIKSLLKSIGLAAIVKGAINAVISGAQHMTTRDRNILANEGQTARIASKEMREEFQGQGSKGIFFAQERKQAMDMARKEQRSQSALDLAGIVGKVAAGTAAGGAVGTLVAPGPGTVVGAIGGGVSAFGGAMTNNRARSKVFDPDQYQSELTKEGMQRYESNLENLKAKKQEKVLSQQYFESNASNIQQFQRSSGLDDEGMFGKNQRNRTTDKLNEISNIPMAENQLIRNSKADGWFTGESAFTNQGKYKSTGTSPLRPEYGGLQADNTIDFLSGMVEGKPVMMDQQLAGENKSEGYLLDQMKGGTDSYKYSEANIKRQRQAILAGGGSTESQEMAGTAAKYERNLNMTNAGSVFGKIAGAGMGAADSSQSTEVAVKKLLAEAMEAGIEASDMPQELKRFTQATAEVMTQGGGLSDTAASRFSSGLLGFSADDISRGKGSFEETKNRSKGAGGIQGQLGHGFMMGDEAKETLGEDAFNKLQKDSDLKNFLNTMSATDIEESGMSKGIAKKLGLKGKEGEEAVMKFMKQMDFTKQSITKDLQDIQKEFNRLTKDMDKVTRSKWMRNEGSEFMVNYTSKMVSQRGAKGKSAVDLVSDATQDASLAPNSEGNFNKTKKKYIDQVNTNLGTSPDTAANKQEEAVASADAVRLKTVRSNIEDLKIASEVYTKNTGEAAKQVEILSGRVKDTNVQMDALYENLKKTNEQLLERVITNETYRTEPN